MISDKLKEYALNNEFLLKPNFLGKTLNIEICDYCNESCIYCDYSSLGWHKKGCMIDEDFFYRITSEAKELGISDVGLYITGEPLLNPNIFKYISYLKKKMKFDYVYISTNGILATPDNIKKLAEAGIDSLKFSVSGANKESFEKHHGVDAFEKVYENIKFAYEYRKKEGYDYKLYMFSIITKFNQQEKGQIRKLYGPYVDEIVFSNVISNQYVKGIKECLCLENDKSSLVEVLAEKSLPCSQLFNRIVISADGYLCACCVDTRSRFAKIEDLKNMSLEEAVYGNRMVGIREDHINKKVAGTICSNCVSGINNKIKGFMDDEMVEPEYVREVDITEKIKKRFL